MKKSLYLVGLLFFVALSTARGATFLGESGVEFSKAPANPEKGAEAARAGGKFVKLAGALNQVTGDLQARAGIEDPAGVLLYQGEDKRFQDRDLQGYRAAYDTKGNQIYLNTQGTDLSRGGDIMRSLYHEGQRKENQSNSFLSSLSDEQQTALATFRGKRAGKVWNRLSGPSTTSNPAAVQDWNTRYKDTLAQSNAIVAQAKDQEVKPLVIEKFHPGYIKAILTGNPEEAARIKGECEKVEDKIVQNAVEVVKNGFQFADGFADALGNNLSLGVKPRQRRGNAYFQTGQKVGDAASLAWGMGEIGFGSSMIGTGGVATVGSGGALAWVGAPAAGAGIALTGHGAVVSDLALKNLMLANYGRVYSKGKQSQEIPAAKGEPVQYKVKKSNTSGKEGATDVPDWAKGNFPKIGESGKEFAKRLMDEKCGAGNYETGAGSHFSKIKKWGDRAFKNPNPKK